LSRREGHDEEEGEMSAKLVMLSELVPHWVHDVVKSYEGDEWIVALKKKLPPRS
jgi:hypothetical protein